VYIAACNSYAETRIFICIDTMFDFSQDIPALAAEASKEHSNIPYIVTAPLGLHELMVVCACEFPLLFLSFSAAVSREAK
jgi:hypothetical protein